MRAACCSHPCTRLHVHDARVRPCFVCMSANTARARRCGSKVYACVHARPVCRALRCTRTRDGPVPVLRLGARLVHVRALKQGGFLRSCSPELWTGPSKLPPFCSSRAHVQSSLSQRTHMVAWSSQRPPAVRPGPIRGSPPDFETPLLEN